MVGAIGSLLVISLAVLTHQQGFGGVSSPCPSIFRYEDNTREIGRWYGVVTIPSNMRQQPLSLNILLDGKADILVNWVGDVSTSNNREFRIENIILESGSSSVRFFVRYNTQSKIPNVQTIKLNGRDICNGGVSTSDQNTYSRPEPVLTVPVSDLSSNPFLHFTSSIRPTQNKDQSNPFVSVQNFVPQTTSTVTKPNTNYGTNTASNPWGNDVEETQPAIIAPQPSLNDKCGKVTKNINPLAVGGEPTLEAQWPWHIALYRYYTVDNKYICGGTLVTRKHVVSAAHCITLKGSKRIVDKDTLTVYLGKHNLRIFSRGVQIKSVDNIVAHPEYNATTYAKDISVLTLGEDVLITDWVRPVCLWPDNQIDLSHIISKKGSIVGWGFDDTGVPTEELTLVKMPVVDQLTCVISYPEFFGKIISDQTFCAGARDGSSVCNGDSGGGMVFNIDSTWYLRGVVSLSVAKDVNRCDPSHYVVFTDVAKFLPWIRTAIS